MDQHTLILRGFLCCAIVLRKMLTTSFKLQEVKITKETFFAKVAETKDYQKYLLMDFCKWCDSGKKKRDRNRKDHGLNEKEIEWSVSNLMCTRVSNKTKALCFRQFLQIEEKKNLP